MIYLITVNYYSGELVARLLASIQSQCFDQIECQLVIVNNSIADQSLDRLIDANHEYLERSQAKKLQLKLINSPENIGFGSACNLGLEWVYAQDPQAIVWLINPDAYLPDGAIAKLQQLQQSHPDLSILGTTIYDHNHQTYFTGGTFSPDTGLIQERIEIQPNANEVINTRIDWVSGCSLIINLTKFITCPKFDPHYFLYYEDFDFCRRYVMQGHTMAIANQIRVVHQTSALTSRNPGFKLKHEIYSYLLSLRKHASKAAFTYRIVRIFLVALLQIGFSPKLAIAKLQGILLCSQKLLQRSNTDQQL